MTGDRILQSKMASAVTHVSLRIPSRSWRPPPILSNLRCIRYLSLYSNYEIANAYLSRSKLNTASLETLRIQCPRSGWVLRIHELIAPDLRSASHAPTWCDFKSMFPSLTRLEVGDTESRDFDDALPTLPLLDLEALPALPPNTARTPTTLYIGRWRGHVATSKVVGAPRVCSCVPSQLRFLAICTP